MKRIMFLLAAVAALASCQNAKDVSFEKLNNYFIRNDAPVPENVCIDVRVDTREAFDEMFGVARVMGKGGEPTPVDFSCETVIAVVNPVTDTYTELEPVSLVKEGKSLVFTYLEKTGEKQEWSMRPLLMVKVKRTDDPGEVRLVKQQEKL